MKFIYLLFFTIILSSCVSTKTIRYYDNKTQLNDKKFIFIALKDQENSLEYEEYKDKISQKLEKFGLHPAKDKSAADYSVKFEYGVNNHKERIGNLSEDSDKMNLIEKPMNRKINLHYNQKKSFVENILFPPLPFQIYDRFFILNITTLKSFNNKPIFEGEVRTQGSCNSFAQVSDSMIDAMFKDFPGKSGKIKNQISISKKDFCN
jgi:hypothetical protein